MNTIPKKYLVWDLETSGFSFTDDRILEVAAMVVEDGKVIHEFSAILNYDIDISEEVSAIHGLTRERCANEGIIPTKVLMRLYTLLKRTPGSVTHNGSRFDIPFLIAELRRSTKLKPQAIDALEQKLRATCFDTAAAYKGRKLGMKMVETETLNDFNQRVLSVMVKGLKYNVGVCCDDLGIDRSGTVQHRASGDVYLTNQIFQKLCVTSS